jgi:hypothetical protein
MPNRDAPASSSGTPASSVRTAEHALRRLGYSRVPEPPRPGAPAPQVWVQEPGVPRRTYPVFLLDAVGDRSLPDAAHRPAIWIASDEARAEAAWQRIRSVREPRADPEVSILVVSPSAGGPPGAHWHEGTVDRRELVDIATGVVVGLFRRASDSGEGGQLDFEELLQILRQRFHLDLGSILGASSDEDALWLMYQLASRHAYAPGDSSANLHLLVLKPTGPAARLPWFAA